MLLAVLAGRVGIRQQSRPYSNVCRLPSRQEIHQQQKASIFRPYPNSCSYVDRSVRWPDLGGAPSRRHGRPYLRPIGLECLQAKRTSCETRARSGCGPGPVRRNFAAWNVLFFSSMSTRTVSKTHGKSSARIVVQRRWQNGNSMGTNFEKGQVLFDLAGTKRERETEKRRYHRVVFGDGFGRRNGQKHISLMAWPL